jgi:hypothetical protein
MGRYKEVNGETYDLDELRAAALRRPSIATGTKVTVGSSSTTILAANANRNFAVFVNDSDETIYLDLSGTAVINSGIRLNANGGAYEINLANMYTGIVTGICSSGSKNITVTEG